MRRLILTAAHGGMCDSPTYRVFCRSLAAARAAGPAPVDCVAFTGHMSEAARRLSAECGVRVVDELTDLADRGNKQRHWLFADFLARRRGEYELVLTVDARDTLFQGNPFGPWDRGEVGPDQVALTAEPANTDEDRWNHGDQGNFRRALRRVWQPAADRGWPIINGGFVGGPAGRMADFQLVRFAVDVRDGGGTDQASLTALGHWVRGWPGFAVVEGGVPWVYHGHWWPRPERYAHPRLTPQGRVTRADGTPYDVFHQWDRVEAARDKILAEYGA